MVCVICYKNINGDHWCCRDCKNVLHGACYLEWSKESETCPYCRAPQQQESSMLCSIFCCMLFVGFSMRIYDYL